MVDFMLGRLCRWLRLIGEDAQYYRSDDDGGIIYRSLKEKRIIITRNRSLSRRKPLGILVIESDDFRQQLSYVVHEFGLKIDDKRIFSRCTSCNMLLEAVNKESIKDNVPEYVFRTHGLFSKCPSCSRIYWKGTHRDLIRKITDNIGIV